jgi:hypothetical protein
MDRLLCLEMAATVAATARIEVVEEPEGSSVFPISVEGATSVPTVVEVEEAEVASRGGATAPPKASRVPATVSSIC